MPALLFLALQKAAGASVLAIGLATIAALVYSLVDRPAQPLPVLMMANRRKGELPAHSMHCVERRHCLAAPGGIPRLADASAAE